MTEATEAVPHVLIVDDEQVILQILTAVLEDEPLRLTCAATGTEARRILDADPPDVLITDKNLPDISGMELLRQSRSQDTDCEVIIITGYASLETAIEAVELGAFDYVTKPLDDVFDIRKKVARALERRSMRIANRRLLGELERRNQELAAALAEARGLQGDLIQSEKMAGIGTLAAGIAHEVSSPLFGVLGLAEAITDAESLDEARGYAASIVEYSLNIKHIVADLTRYSRDTSDIDAAPVLLIDVIGHARRLVQLAADQTVPSVDITVDPELWVEGIAGELQQVMVILLTNAAHAVSTSAHPRISIEASVDGDTVHVAVCDNGVGIAAESLPKVFDPFYTTKPPGEGTGLGLSIAYRIVARHQGTLRVSSTPSEGTRFSMTLPASASGQ